MQTALELGVWVLGGAASTLAASIVVYALGSFVLMRPHTPARAAGRALSAFARELVCAAWTQPLLPLFYVLGRRMARAAREGTVPVVFVHGYMQNRVGFVGLARALARRGIGPLYGFNYPWFASIASNAARLERFVDRVRAETGGGAVDLVCHSMGGLIAVEMIRGGAGAAKKVRRCVTIATPHAGIAWRGPLPGFGASSLRRGSKLLEAHAALALTAPTLSVFSTHDNVVYPKETSQLRRRGGRDIEVDGLAHLSILFSPAVAEHVATFLLEPDPPPSEVVVAAPRGAAGGAADSPGAHPGGAAGGSRL